MQVRQPLRSPWAPGDPPPRTARPASGRPVLFPTRGRRGGVGETVGQAGSESSAVGDLGWRRRGSLSAPACLSLSVLSPWEFQLCLFFQEALCLPGLWRARGGALQGCPWQSGAASNWKLIGD